MQPYPFVFYNQSVLSLGLKNTPKSLVIHAAAFIVGSLHFYFFVRFLLLPRSLSLSPCRRSSLLRVHTNFLFVFLACSNSVGHRNVAGRHLNLMTIPLGVLASTGVRRIRFAGMQTDGFRRRATGYKSPSSAASIFSRGYAFLLLLLAYDVKIHHMTKEFWPIIYFFVLFTC